MNYNLIIDFIKSLYPDTEPIPLHAPHFGGNEKKYLEECINSTFVSSVGKYVDKFEEHIRNYTGAKYAIATVNGTAALHIALKLAGVETGDLVITQPLTFVATCNAISYCGAEPIFVDIDRKTLGMSADALERWLSTNTIIENGACYYKGVHVLHQLHKSQRIPGQVFSKQSDELSEGGARGAKSCSSEFEDTQCVKISDISGLRKITACVPMHTFGHPCEIDRIADICKRYHIALVEDSAESIGSYYKGRHTGTFGKIGILSFNGNKTITTGGGGMIITNDDVLGPLAKHITTTAKKPHPWKFEHDIIGYNYRMPNINAALGCAQMEMLPEFLANKRETASQYKAFFQTISSVEFVTEPKDCISNFWLNAILLPDEAHRDAFLKASNDARVITRPAWILMNELVMFSKAECGDITVAEEIAARLVNLPSSFRKTKRDA